MATLKLNPRFFITGLGLVLVVTGLSALVAFPLWKQVLSRYSPDGRVEPETWLYLRILVTSATIPGVVVLMRRAVIRWLDIADQWVATLSRKRFIAGVIVISAVARAMVIILLPSVLHADWQAYHELASTWAETGDYRSQGLLTAYWPPGWPWLLSRLYLLFGPEPLAGYLWNVCLSAAIIALCFAITHHVWDERHARWAAVITGFLPSQILFTNRLCSEFTFTTLFLASIYLVLRASDDRRPWRSSLAGGIALGLATLTRTVTTLYPAVLLTMFWGPARGRLLRLGRWGLLVAAMAAVITPWCVRNYNTIGRFTIATNTGVNLYIGNNPWALGTWAELDPRIIESWNTSKERYNDSLGTARAIENVLSHPYQFLKRMPVKVAFTFIPDIEALTYEIGQAVERNGVAVGPVLAVISQGVYTSVLLFVLMGLGLAVRGGGMRKPRVRLLLLTILYWTGVHIVAFGHGRFHFPIVAIMAGFAAHAVVISISKTSERID